jgi:hypothetical protein
LHVNYVRCYGENMAVDVLTVVLTAVCTGIGISIGNGLYEIYFKEPLKKLRKQNERLRKLHKKLSEYKRPWLAALLNLFIWGAGYFYVKRRRLFGALLFLVELFTIGGYVLSTGNINTAFEGVSYSFLTIIISITLGIDAYNQAGRYNQGKD